MKPQLLEVDDFHLSFDTFDGESKVLDGISLSLKDGETLGIVGETGCGKSVLARSVMALNPVPPARVLTGSIRFRGSEILGASEADMRNLRGRKISMIFQDPASYLNPLLTIGSQMVDALRGQHSTGGHKTPARSELLKTAADMLAQVGLPEPGRLLRSYPHQSSGGMRQRILIAMALSGNPDLLIADEPTTALDVTVQAQVLALIASQVKSRSLSLIMITHDLGVVSAVCERIAVMYAGTIVESGSTIDVLDDPLHPYSKGLISAVPDIDRPSHKPKGLSGHIPNLLEPPTGCRFNPRCTLATDECKQEKPQLREIRLGRHVACHLVSR